MDRRQFLGWVGVGALASYLPVVIAACSPEQQPKSETTPGGSESASAPNAEGFLAMGTSQELSEKGQLVNKQFDVMVIRNEDSSLSALNPRCTHQGCTVDWEQGKNKFACPCHGSQFATDGKVLKGPADKALASYEVKEEDGSILVKVS